MATIQPVGNSFKIDGTNVYVLGDGAKYKVSTKVIQLVSSAFSGSIAVKGRVTGTANTPVAIPYRKRYLNGAVGDDTFVSTAITTDSLIEVNADGIDVILDVTYTSGTMAVRSVDLVG